MTLKIRLSKQEDRAYIASSMYKYLLARNSFKPIGDAFNAYFDALMENCLVKVAYDDEAEDVIMAYCVYKEDKGVLHAHFLYTRYSFRCCGIGVLLLDAVTANYDKFYYFLSTPRIDGIILETNAKEGHETLKKLISKAVQLTSPNLLFDFNSRKKSNSSTPPKT